MQLLLEKQWNQKHLYFICKMFVIYQVITTYFYNHNLYLFFSYTVLYSYLSC